MDVDELKKLALLKILNSNQNKSLPYQTNLNPSNELGFQNWVLANNVPVNNSPKSDYDMRGFYQALQQGNPNARTEINPSDNQLHFSDTFKTPFHRTFSNESVYADKLAPHWEGSGGGGGSKLVSPNKEVIELELPRTSSRSGRF